MVHARDEWRRISLRIQTLLSTGNFYFASLNSNSSDGWGGDREIYKECQSTFSALEKFHKNYSCVMSNDAKELVDEFLSKYKNQFNLQLEKPNGIDAKGAIKFLIPALSSLEANVTYSLNNTQVHIRKTVEVAFAHLQRRIAADSHYRTLWQEAKEKGETQFEQLGGEHLLLHKIWAFKAYAAGERTDLILNEAIKEDDPLYASVEGLVLTEWKCADEKNYRDRIIQAKEQANIYGKSSLYSLELASLRYLVIVSEKRLEIKQLESESEGIIYRVVNIVYSPDNPSNQVKKLKNHSN